MKKTFAVVLVMIMISILAVGCAPKTNAPTPQQSTTLPADTEKQGDTANQEDTPQGEDEEKSDDKIIETEGIYEGQVDNNFIEIKLETADNPVEFSISEIADSFEGFDIGSKVKITYIVNQDNQNILKSIKKVN